MIHLLKVILCFFRPKEDGSMGWSYLAMDTPVARKMNQRIHHERPQQLDSTYG